MVATAGLQPFVNVWMITRQWIVQTPQLFSIPYTFLWYIQQSFYLLPPVTTRSLFVYTIFLFH